ncbi:MAG TPA: heme exporter protein CcmB [Bryobacteraceae bacterium]|jgi:heme exporter protein B|nr:heme exporter protein CcmB [Bryobacteraceae bacterium]
MRVLNAAWVVARKDLRAELRTKETLNASLSFALVILLLFSFILDPDSQTMRAMSGGLLWLVFMFAGALILNRSFARELPNDCLEALIASPASGAELFLGKCVASFILLLVVEVICLPVFGIFYNVRWTRQTGLLIAVLLLGGWALTVIGTLFSALTVNLRLRELMLPTLIYPFLVPALMAAIQLTNVLIGGDTLERDDYIWFRVLIGFDVIFSLLGLALAESVFVG